jgi:ATP-dependent RNA helicase DDX35
VDESVGESLSTPFNYSTAPLAQQRMLLPIYKHKRQILYALEEYAVVVIVGETGSGKSTQIPAYLWENGWADNGFQVVCTQPRRIAAQSLAQRVSQEAGKRIGQEVGYTVRFDDCTSPLTRVKYVTDGMLLREATLSDPLLSNYSVIMIDESHERNLNSDALLGIVKKIRRKRRDLRVIICSATIDAQGFLDFLVPQHRAGKKRRRWDSQPDDSDRGTIISVDGRQYPVDMLYTKAPISDYIRYTVETVQRIHEQDGGADILAFLPSGEDIDNAIKLAEDSFDEPISSSKRTKRVVFLPLYGSLPQQMQAKVFQPKTETNVRRIIFATNIAETSVTVTDITHVIDCGFAKTPYFDPKTGFERLIVAPISRASANQRAGRAGRVQPGKCFRLYTEKYFADTMQDTTPPEVMRTNLTSFILTLKALGVQNILSFDLIDLPSLEALSHGLETLYALGALDDNVNLTTMGLDMSAFPTEPRVSRMLLESLSSGCSWEVLAVASAMQVRALFVQPRTQRQRLDYDAAMSDWADPSGDHVTYANLLAEVDDRDMDQEECKEKFINVVALKRAMEVRAQLAKFLRSYGKVQALGTIDAEERSNAIRRCVTAGFFMQTAKLANDGRYYTLRGHHLIAPSPSSVLYAHGAPSEYILFGETYDGVRGGIETRHCSAIQAKWLHEVAPQYWE